MGNYNSQYENYYNTILSKKIKRSSYKGRNSGVYRGAKINREEGNLFFRRIIQELCGVLILFMLVLGCRVVVTPKTQAVYNFCEEMLNKEYDYKEVFYSIKRINFNDLQQDIVSEIEEIRCKITGEKTIKEKLKENFKFPVEGEIVSSYGEIKLSDDGKEYINNGVDIQVTEGSDIKAAFDGRVKKSSEDDQFGKYVVIDHGDGIETMYSNFQDVFVSVNDHISKDELIGKGKENSLQSSSKVHFELLYMGENKNPQEYISMN